MSNLTTTIKELVEKYGSGETLRDKITTALPNIFDFDYPIFDETYRTVLETKIIKRYLSREICSEDEELWKLMLDGKLNEIMPFYNNLYKTTLLEINPLLTHNMTTEKSGSNTGSNTTETIGTKSGNSVENSNGTRNDKDEHNNSAGVNTQSVGGSTYNSTDSTSTTEKRNNTSHSSTTLKENDTPGGSISSLDDGYLSKVSNTTSTGGNVDDNTSNTSHTNAGTDKNNNTTVQTSQDNYNGESSGTTTDHKEISATDTTSAKTEGSVISTDYYLEKITGYSGVSQSKLLNEYRETILNIDEQILYDLADLFIFIY